MGSGGVIKNLISGGGNIFTGTMCVGGIAGELRSAEIINCTSYATVVAVKSSSVDGRYAGGIVGSVGNGNVKDCRNYGSVTASRNAGGIVGRSEFGSITNSLNFAQVTADQIYGGILGNHSYTSISNNYYAGDCNVGGIDGSDATAQAMRGYAISGGEAVCVELIEDATVGVAYNETVYAGEGQQVVLRLSLRQSGAQSAPAMRAPGATAFKASNGDLVDNGDGTWTLTVTAEDVTITVDDTPTGVTTVNADAAKSGRRYNLMGQPVGKDYKGIVIEDGKKVIVR